MHYIVLYPQNGDRIVTIDSVTSLHAMYTFHIILLQTHFICIQLSLFLQLCDDDELYGRLAKRVRWISTFVSIRAAKSILDAAAAADCW